MSVCFATAENSSCTAFLPFEDDSDLPFPLNTHPILKFSLAFSLLLVLILGTDLRLKIFSFLRSPESNLGPINVFIWADELTGKN